MQEHNFEKQVQQKMDELSITPSAPVWQKVEEEIRKKKDRRRIAFWLMPLLLICGGLSWWVLHSPDRTTTASTQTGQPASEQNNYQTPATADTLEKAERTVSISETTDSEFLVTQLPTASTEQPGNKAQDFNTTHSNPMRAHVPTLLAKNESRQAETLNNAAHPDEGKEAQSASPAALKRPAEHLSDSFETQEPAFATSDHSVKEDIKLLESKENAPDSLSVAKGKTQESHEEKWQWDIHASAGISSVKRGLFYSNTMSLDYFQAPAAGGVTPPPSQVRKGMEYSFGIALKRKISERMSVTGGMQYHLFSTRMATGAQINRDTVINNNSSYRDLSSYYQTGRQRDYTNNYHFVELPVGIEYQPIRSLPLRLHTGLIVGRLVNTNALVYDRWNNIYYKDNSVLNKTQWQVFGNLNYRIFKTGRGSVHAGPYLQYGFRGLEKVDQGKKYHLFSAGLRTHISF